MTAADVIVVGAGGGGAPLAARLSEDPSRRVLLLEAGHMLVRPEEVPPELRDAGVIAGARPDHPANGEVVATLAPGREYGIARGRIAGGSTATNGGYFERARREDFALWSAGGNDAWGFEAVLPLLRRLESDLDHGDSPLHGAGGPMPVRRSRVDHPVVQGLLRGAGRLGIPEEPDKNGEQAPGVGPVPSNAVDGERRSTAVAYLAPALGRPNLELCGGARVRRVLVEAGRAVGVEVERDRATERLEAGEVVLSAGVYGTAALLLRSGVGPADELAALGVPVVLDLPGVGREVDDHPQLVLSWTPRRAARPPVGSWMGPAVNLLEADGTGLEILSSLVPMPALLGLAERDEPHPLPLLVSVQDRARTGRVRLRSADPAAPPSVGYRYLATGEQRRAMRRAARLAAELVAASGGELAEPVARLDDAELDAMIRARLGTAIHACGGARFGPPGDGLAVVDQHGRVAGVEGLRIADTSILPTAPLRGPAATAVLVGELVADAIRAGA